MTEKSDLLEIMINNNILVGTAKGATNSNYKKSMEYNISLNNNEMKIDKASSNNKNNLKKQLYFKN